MTRRQPWMYQLKPGELVESLPLWNASSRPPLQLPTPVKVLAVKQAQSQTGVLFCVQNNRGQKCWLDAAWFRPYDIL